MKLKDLTDTLMPMLDDAHWAEEAMARDDNQFTRRAYIRSIFAMIEGTTWVLKQTLLKAIEMKGKKFRPGEYELLSDRSYELKENGDIKEQTKFLKLPDNIRFTYKALGKYTKTEFDLGVGTIAWDNFLEALKIRNRITHPKNTSEFSVSDSEIAICQQVTSWFNLLTLQSVKVLFNQP
ncbi:hypothetical protein ABRY74_22000 [Pseudomonas guariconensis]|uniref:hypothetical protein n=1 Tax=Pseudomonas guariconensis TaxID=1288410 RepID=UPI003EE05F61